MSGVNGYEKIIELSRNKIKRSTVINKSTNDISDVRTSSNTFLTDSVDPLLKNIDDNDIQTTNFSIYPIYEYPEIITPGKNTRTQTLVGYRVNNSISVKIRNIESTGTVIDEVTNVGENAIRINNISFDRENTDEFINELRKQAVENASFKAKQLSLIHI